jgi:hypothetical protein
LITAVVIASVSISSVLIARRVAAFIVVHVLALIVRSMVHAVVIVGGHFFLRVCMLKERFRVGLLSRWRQIRRGRNFLIVMRTLSGGSATVNQ